MHSRIIELKLSPIPKEERAKEYDIPEWFVGSIADYTDLINDEEERADSFKWAAGFIGASVKDDKLIITKENCEAFFSYRLKVFKEATEALREVETIEDFIDIGTGYKMHCLNSAYDDKYGFYVYEGGDFISLDKFMKYVFVRMNESEERDITLYCGSAFDYHF